MPDFKLPVRFVSRGALKMDAFVTHRDADFVYYNLGDPESTWQLSPAKFDAAYTIPGLPGKR